MGAGVVATSKKRRLRVSKPLSQGWHGDMTDIADQR